MKRFTETTLTKSLDGFDSQFGGLIKGLSIEDRVFIRERIFTLPRKIQYLLLSRYQELDKPFNANSYLRVSTDKIKEILTPKLREYFDATEDDLRTLSEDCALQCKRIGIREKKASLSRAGAKPKSVLVGSIYSHCANYVGSYGIVVPGYDDKHPIEGAIKRMQDQYWWLRKLRKLLVRKREQAMIILGQVNNRKGKYCSDLTLQQRILQKMRQETLLDNLVMVNELNEEFALKEIFEANVSNPVNRRNELMTRMAGCEKLSKELGHIALFVTITCPSKFHNSYAKSGDTNPKWDGSTPYEAQEYLNTVWRRIRAEMARQCIQQYGFRISEPQHDGTPHWHLLIFIEPKHREALIDIYTHYAMEEDGSEKGAYENRITFFDIDPARGSATGYVAKYVSKNIDGGHLDSDIDGGDAATAARRVEAWASCWGIRQFQQLGCVSVTVWREMRRLKKAENQSEQFQSIHAAADSGNWAEYVSLMGGVFCKRDEQVIRPFYSIDIDTDSGEVKQSYFDGIPTIKIKGVKHQGAEIITRVHQWRIERRSQKKAA